MTDGELIRTAVIGDATLADLLGSFEGNPAIFPVVLPMNPPLPAITYFLVSQPTDFTQDDAQFRWPRYRFRIYSKLHDELTEIRRALAALFGYQDRTPFLRSHIEYPPSNAEGHEDDTHRYWQAMDVCAFMAAGAESQ